MAKTTVQEDWLGNVLAADLTATNDGKGYYVGSIPKGDYKIFLNAEMGEPLDNFNKEGLALPNDRLGIEGYVGIYGSITRDSIVDVFNRATVALSNAAGCTIIRTSGGGFPASTRTPSGFGE